MSEEVLKETEEKQREKGKEEKDPQKIIEELQKELQKVKAEAQEHYDRLLRIYAEFDNYKKRVAREKAELVKYGNEELLRELLPVLDNLERAIEHAKGEADPKGVLEGVELVAQLFRGVLRKFGVTEIEAVGETFDPSKHEAVGEVLTDEVPPGQIVSEVQKGYMLADRLLRPARVVVAKERKEEEGGPSDRDNQ